MAEYPYQRPANGLLERRLTRLEMQGEHHHEEIEDLWDAQHRQDDRHNAMVDRIRSMAFQVVAAIAGSAILVLVNILLGRATG